MRAYERLLKYVSVYTTSDPDSATVPSSMRQYDLANILVDELKALGLQQNALQHRDGRAHGDSFGNAVDGCTEQCFIADDVQNSISPFSHFRLDLCPLGCCRKAVIY